MAKQRIDQMLVDRGLVESRSRAQALVMAGLVFSGETKIAKPGQQLAEDAVLDVRGRDHPWVSRGDQAGARAGAFRLGRDRCGCDRCRQLDRRLYRCIAAKGAARVYAVDSGTNQLAWSLRQDPRVIVHEQTSARILTEAHIPEPVDIIVCDASFIGLAKVLERPLSFARPGARLLALIKPQFEAGREEVGKGGVVRDPAVHQRVCDQVVAWLTESDWHVAGVTRSPITGPEGNIEFLVAASRN